MSAVSLFPLFMVGLLGSVHCIGMCGGIVGALSAASPPAARRFPVAVTAEGRTVAPQLPRSVEAFDGALRVLAYNIGRISSYMAAGAIAGGVSGSLRAMSGIAALQLAGYWLANLMLVALGLTLMQAWGGLARLEAFAQPLWRRLQPLIRQLAPMDNPAKALALGALWGWLPCGMVYSVLFTAMFSGSAAAGALAMLAFGLGTLPMLLGLGLAGQRLRGWLRRRGVRFACGAIVLGFGLLGLLRAAGGMAPSWLDAVCITPSLHAQGGLR